MRPEFFILGIAAILGLCATGIGALVYGELNARGREGAGKLLVATADGLRPTPFSVSALADRARGGVRTNATVTSSGAAALPVTLELLRYDRLRSWTLTSANGAVSAPAPLVVDLSAHPAVLDILRDAPLLPDDPQEHAVPVDCDYVAHNLAGRQFACLMLVSLAQRTLTIFPLELDTVPGDLATLQPMGKPAFQADQVGWDITLSARFGWIVPDRA